MSLTLRITRFRLIVVCLLLVFVALAVLIGRLLLTPHATFKDRNAIKARLLLPRELRAFPIEKHLASGDTFTYRITSRPKAWRTSVLEIDTSPDRFDHYHHAFNAYLAAYTNVQTLGRTILFSKRDNNAGDSLLIVGNTRQCGRLRITFTYYELGLVQKFLRTRYGRPLRPLFRKLGWQLDGFTLPS
jgi:hypothetical protein